MRERVYGLSDMKTTILRHILLSYDRRGTRPSKLVDLLDRDKSTISYHLRMLSEQEIIKSDKQGRQVFYKLRDAAKPFVQIRIDEESA
jgi:DNA-binding transcriptional ArsR family regulator